MCALLATLRIKLPTCTAKSRNPVRHKNGILTVYLVHERLNEHVHSAHPNGVDILN